MGGSGVYRFLLPPPKKSRRRSFKKWRANNGFAKKIANRMHCPNFFWRREGRNRSHTPKIARQDPPIKPAIKGAPPYYMRENNCSEKEKKGRFAFFVRNRKDVKKERKGSRWASFFLISDGRFPEYRRIPPLLPLLIKHFLLLFYKGKWLIAISTFFLPMALFQTLLLIISSFDKAKKYKGILILVKKKKIVQEKYFFCF